MSKQQPKHKPKFWRMRFRKHDDEHWGPNHV